MVLNEYSEMLESKIKNNNNSRMRNQTISHGSHSDRSGSYRYKLEKLPENVVKKVVSLNKKLYNKGLVSQRIEGNGFSSGSVLR